jgi:hypothetical protein
VRLGHVVEGEDAQAEAEEQHGAEGDEGPERELRGKSASQFSKRLLYVHNGRL